MSSRARRHVWVAVVVFGALGARTFQRARSLAGEGAVVYLLRDTDDRLEYRVVLAGPGEVTRLEPLCECLALPEMNLPYRLSRTQTELDVTVTKSLRSPTVVPSMLAVIRDGTNTRRILIEFK